MGRNTERCDRSKGSKVTMFLTVVVVDSAKSELVLHKLTFVVTIYFEQKMKSKDVNGIN